MSEHENKIGEEMASEIIVSTCQLLPKSSSAVSDHMNNLVASKEPNPMVYSILCGSFAECYIRPLIPCISDVDFLKCHANTLAFTGELPVLPIDIRGISDRIFCNKLEPYHESPGFVRLRFIGVMQYNCKYKKYELEHFFHPKAYSTFTLTTDGTWHHSNTRRKSTAQLVI